MVCAIEMEFFATCC